MISSVNGHFKLSGSAVRKSSELRNWGGRGWKHRLSVSIRQTTSHRRSKRLRAGKEEK